jgi:hypothetical protein
MAIERGRFVALQLADLLRGRMARDGADPAFARLVLFNQEAQLIVEELERLAQAERDWHVAELIDGSMERQDGWLQPMPGWSGSPIAWLARHGMIEERNGLVRLKTAFTHPLPATAAPAEETMNDA